MITVVIKSDKTIRRIVTNVKFACLMMDSDWWFFHCEHARSSWLSDRIVVSQMVVVVVFDVVDGANGFHQSIRLSSGDSNVTTTSHQRAISRAN